MFLKAPHRGKKRADTGVCPYVFLNSMQGFAVIVVY